MTPSERYLAYLARASFLSLWSYANVFTDEGRKNHKGDGKELCDLFVAFDRHVILFSDKHSAFPDHTDIKLAWARWYRRAVQSSVNQLLGAKSWLGRFPNRIYLDRQCTQPLPIPLPALSETTFHLIAVTRGSYDKCQSFFSGGSTGSLVIKTDVKGRDHLNDPFVIGHVSPNRGYVHVFDEMTLDVVLRELDTITDFVTYLQKKESLLTRPGLTVIATGEEELIGRYLTPLEGKGECDFGDVPEDFDTLLVKEGYWDRLKSSRYYALRKEADRVSYAWDRLIEHFIASGLVESQTDGSYEKSTRHLEPALRVLASEPRSNRRWLAAQLLTAMQKKVEPNQRFTRLCLSKDTGYLFLVFPRPDFVATEEEYREMRGGLLFACCQVAKIRAPQAQRIVGIATEPYGSERPSEDLQLLDTSDKRWTSQHQDEAKKLQKEAGIFIEELARD